MCLVSNSSKFGPVHCGNLSQWKHISMALSAFGNLFLVSRTCAVALLVCIGVRGCGCPSFTSFWHIETAVFTLMKRAPNSASTTDDMTAQIICKILRKVPLLKGMLSFLAMNMRPPTPLQDFGLNKYDASLWIAKTMLLAW